ncbi:DUF4328 domain-containing protein [Streptomyces sp. NPDC005498]|uniref:DUF4328 domain-containing protein n=1 Tax=Streptomyces sp. NPDC005498 TaxID=3364717 RepID=UPI0036744521
MVEVDTYFRNLMGWRTGLLLVALLQFSVWLAGMRDLADVIWRQGQRRHRAWLVFGWVIPLGQLFIPKMFINDLWAASRPEPQRRRGHPLLTAWWLSVLVAANAYSDAPEELKKAATTSQARQALHQIMFSDGPTSRAQQTVCRSCSPRTPGPSPDSSRITRGASSRAVTSPT